MGSATLWSLILILSAFLNCKVAGVGQLGSLNGATPTLLTSLPTTSKAITHSSIETTAAPSENKTTTTTAPTTKPITHTTRNVTQVPTMPVATTMTTTAHTMKPTTHTTTNSTQAPTSPLNTTVHTTAHTTQTTNHTTAHSTQAPTVPANTTAHTTANTSVPANHTTANSTVAPTLPINITTTIPANHTTIVPANLTTHTTTNGTHTTTQITVMPTPTYSPKPSTPTTGDYSVSEKGANCIMALMGLEFTVHAKEERYFTIEPNQTSYSGSCGTSSSNLNITFHGGFINFNFMKDEHHYFIDRIQALLPSMSVHQIANQTLMKTTLGSSFKCKSMQKFPIEKDLSLIMVNARIQAFKIEHNSFGTESVCFQDNSSRIAIAVGLTVVVIIILGIILYFIYRRKRSSGYQRL